MTLKIFIAGCARSGTDLCRDLFRCFRDTHVVRSEHGPGYFPEVNESAATVVIKRGQYDYRELPGLAPGIELFYCVRHPYDCLTSAHPNSIKFRPFHVTRERWIAEYTSLLAFKKLQAQRRIFFQRYEDVVNHPDECQRRMAEHFRLNIDVPFTENKSNIRFFNSSLRKWEKNEKYRDYIDNLDAEFKQIIKTFCDEFGYDS